LAPITGALVLSFVFSSSASAATDLATITKTSDFNSTEDYFLSSNIGNISLMPDDDTDNIYSIFTSFSGTLNGNGFSISGLNKPLFGNLDQAEVSNLILNTVEDGISTDGAVGVLASTSIASTLVEVNSTVDNVTVNGKINAAGDYIGGIIGLNNKSNITNSEANIEITFASGTPDFVGGIVGFNSGGIIDGSTARGSVSGSEYVGGIVGLNTENGSVTNSTSLTTVFGSGFIGGIAGDNRETDRVNGLTTISGSKFNGAVSGFNSIGGAVGENSGDISGTVSSGSVTAFNQNAGGLAGLNWSGNIENSASNANVSASQTVGGLVGWSDGNASISNSAAQGNVNGDSAVGGLVGKNVGEISNSIATGNVSESTSGSGIDIGGLVGTNESANSSVTNSIATGTVTGSGKVGGLIGNSLLSVISNSIATGDVNGVTVVGGLIGISDRDAIIGSHASGDVMGSGNQIGGLIGSAGGSNITGSTASGEASGANTVGGLIGYGDRAFISNSGASGNVAGENYVGGFIADDGYNVISNSIASGNVTGENYVGSFSAASTRGSIGGTNYPAEENSISMGSTTGAGEQVGGFYGYRNLAASETSREATTQADALTVINNGLEVEAWEVNPNSSLNHPSLIVNNNRVTMISVLNKNLIEPKWGNNKYINGGKPYLIALLSSGIYSDTTPVPTYGGNSNGGYGVNNRSISLEEIAKRESSGRKILESLKNDVKKIEVEDFKSAGIFGVTGKSLPIVVELLAELEIQVFETPTVQKVVEIAGTISRIITTNQGKNISYVDLRKLGITEIEYSELKDFSKFLSLIPADNKNSIKEIQNLVSEFRKNKEEAVKAREAKKEATRIQREKNLQLVLSMFKK
jgi:hypothetical protein